MPVRSDNSRAALRHVREGVDNPATYGVVPAGVPLTTSTIMTTESLKGASGVKESEISKQNRLPGPRRETSLSGGGDVNIEGVLCPEFDRLLEDACCDLFYGVGTRAGVDISAANADNSLNAVAATRFDGIVAGDYIDVSGYVATVNNKRWLVASKPTSQKLILATVAQGGIYGGSLTTEAAGPSVTLVGGAFISSAISAASGDNSINDASNLLFANIPVGAWIKMSGWAAPANNDYAYVVSKPSAGKLVLAYIVLVTEAIGPAVTVAGRLLRDGTKLITRTFERDRPELSTNRYQAYKGQYCNGMELTFTFEEIVKGKFTYMGRGPEAQAAASLGTGTPITAAATTDLLDVSNNMRAFRSSGTLDGNIRSLTIQLANNGELIKLAQTVYPDGVSMGVAALTGTLEGYLVDASGRQVAAFARTPDSYHFKIIADSGRCMIVSLYRVLYNDKGDVGKGARTGPAMLSLPWAAEEDPNIGHWIQFAAFGY